MEHTQPYQPRLELFATRTWRRRMSNEPQLRIVSGGQTGVDRAALDAALALGFGAGGWCPLGRRSEDGEIPARYPLVETASDKYPVRTRMNVHDSDATLILTLGEFDSGTRLTAEMARRMGKPCLVVQLDGADAIERARSWLAQIRPAVLNIAGPRESKRPGIYGRAFAFLSRILKPELTQ
jgi:Circularly permutated YpsA SLOG family